MSGAAAPDAQQPLPTPVVAALRWAELVAVFFAIPAIFAAYVDPQRRFDPVFSAIGLDALLAEDFRRAGVLMPGIIVFSLIILLALILDRSFPRRAFWNWRATKAEFQRIVVTFALGAVAMLGAAWSLAAFTDIMTRPDGVSAFLFLPREMPHILFLIAIGYPWFSCYPQEITHRAFFFHRYRAILPGRWSMIAVNAVAFCWLHAPFWHPIALLITLPGGVLFAWTYDRTKSTLAVTLEHAAFGWWAFATGLGYFVFAGSLQR